MLYQISTSLFILKVLYTSLFQTDYVILRLPRLKNHFIKKPSGTEHLNNRANWVKLTNNNLQIQSYYLRYDDQMKLPPTVKYQWLMVCKGIFQLQQMPPELMLV